MAFLNDTGLNRLQEYILSKIRDKIAAASSITPKAAETASAGTETTFARGDHAHPAQTIQQQIEYINLYMMVPITS